MYAKSLDLILRQLTFTLRICLVDFFPFFMGITAHCLTVHLVLLGEQGKPWSLTTALKPTFRTLFFSAVSVLSCILVDLLFIASLQTTSCFIPISPSVTREFSPWLCERRVPVKVHCVCPFFSHQIF